jgi:hypothetical protein
MSQEPPQEEQTSDQSDQLAALTAKELEQITAFFTERLIGQPEVVQTLANVLYKQNALLKRVLEQDEADPHPAGVPADPTVILLMGGSWGKSLATRLIPMALGAHGRGSLTVLTPLPQDPDGTLNMDPNAVAAPFATVVVENIESLEHLNARFLANLAHLLETGIIGVPDYEEKRLQPVPLGLATFMLTTSVADKEIREALDPEARLGFLPPAEEQPPDAAQAYAEVRRICERALDWLPHELLRAVDETVILRPLSQADLARIFDLEIGTYEQAMFPGQALRMHFDPGAKESLFAEAQAGLHVYGTHTLRRVLQRYVDPVVYRAFNTGHLTEDNLDQHQVRVGLSEGQVTVNLE